MGSAKRVNAVVGQSGGPTAVINQSLVGVVEGLRGYEGVDKVLGARHAVSGIVKNDFIELQGLGQDLLDRVAATPSAALGSSRDKPDAEYCKKIFAAFDKQNVGLFFYIGGNDSSDTCRIVSELAKEAGYPLRAFHVPKTIDNDLKENDHTPGYASAAKFVAQALMGDDLDNRSLPGVKIDVIMGRHAGFLTAAAALGRQKDTDGPHLVYVPEVAFDVDKFLADVDRIYKQLGRCVIAVSEGVHDSEGTPIITKLASTVEKDAHGNVQLSGSGALGDHLADLIRNKLKIKRVRADTLGYLQRSFVGCTSPVDAAEARQAGRHAAELAKQGATEGSITINRASAPGSSYQAVFGVTDLRNVAGKTRVLDPSWIIDGNQIAPAFHEYLLPLVGELPVVDRLPGF